MNSHSEKLARSLSNLSTRIAKDLLDRQKEGQFEERDYYGKAFLLATLHQLDSNLYTCEIQALRGAISAQEKNKTFHYEFNRFALIDIFPEKVINKILCGYRYTGTRVANWTLLRAYCRLKSKSAFQNLLGKLELFVVKRRFLFGDLVEDKVGEYTSQYDFFSLLLLLMVSKIDNKNLDEAFFSSTARRCLEQVTLDGLTNFIGRGAMQTFGYAALIYFLSFFELEDIDLQKFRALIRNLEREYSRGNFMPLVINKEVLEPESYNGTPDLMDEQFLGWYSYNNAPDYQAFLAYFLINSSKLLNSQQRKISLRTRNTQIIPSFRKISRNIFKFENYKYFLLAGVASIKLNQENLFSPVIMIGNKVIFSPTSGEQSKPSLNNNQFNQLPICKLGNRILSLRSCSAGAEQDNTLIINLKYEKGLRIQRKIICLEQVTIIDTIVNLKKIQHIKVEIDYAQTIEKDFEVKGPYLKNGEAKSYYYESSSCNYTTFAGRKKILYVELSSNKVRFETKLEVK